MLASSRSRAAEESQCVAPASGQALPLRPRIAKCATPQAPAKHSQVATGGVTKPQRGPVARASLRSSVATLEPRNSASATYQASYDVTFARSSHTLGANGA